MSTHLVQNRFAKIRALTRQKNVFKWQNVCRSLSLTHNVAEIKKFARIFGVPPTYWNNPRKICSLITPRVTDFLEKVYCSNVDEPTMEGDEVGNIPEFLKYTFEASNGQIYCYSIVDLFNAVQHDQTMDPYRRFTLPADEIIERYNFLKSVLEPQGLGSSVMDNIQNTPLTLTPTGLVRNKLSIIWNTLNYPKYTVDEVIHASEEVLNGLWEAVSKQDGLSTLITNQERSLFTTTRDRATKLKIFVETLLRLFTNDPLGVVPVALELAINSSVERSNGTLRRRRSSVSSNGRNTRRRTLDLVLHDIEILDNVLQWIERTTNVRMEHTAYQIFEEGPDRWNGIWNRILSYIPFRQYIALSDREAVGNANNDDKFHFLVRWLATIHERHNLGDIESFNVERLGYAI